MDYHTFRREYLLGFLGKLGVFSLKATVGNRVKPDYHFIRTVFLLFSVSLSQIPVFPCTLCSKACQHISDIVGLSQAEV